MGDSSVKEPWVLFLEQGLLQARTPDGYAVYEVSLKLRVTDILAVVRAVKEEEYFVLFVSGRSLKGVASNIRVVIRGTSGRWRKDRYAPV